MLKRMKISSISKIISSNFRLKYQFSVVEDPYRVLNIEKHEKFEDIKKKYFELASYYHPDKNKDPVKV